MICDTVEIVHDTGEDSMWYELMDAVGVVGQRLEYKKRQGGSLSDYRLEELVILTFYPSCMFFIQSTL